MHAKLVVLVFKTVLKNCFRCKKFNIVNFKLGADATEIPVLLIGFDPVREG